MTCTQTYLDTANCYYLTSKKKGNIQVIPFLLQLQYVKKHRIPELITLCERAQYWQYTEQTITDNMKCTTLPSQFFQSFPGRCQTLDGRWLNEEKWWRETAAAEAASRWRTQPWSIGSQVTMWMKCLFVFLYMNMNQFLSLYLKACCIWAGFWSFLSLVLHAEPLPDALSMDMWQAWSL